MADVFDVLGADHAEVRHLLTELEAPVAGTSEAALAGRAKLAERLIIESSRHEAAEEQYFWPAVRQYMPDGNQLADEAISQEGAAKEVLARLDTLTAGDPEFERAVLSFVPDCRQHIEFEETKVWPKLRTILSADKAEELGGQIATAKERGPTRPHPHSQVGG